MTAFVGVAHSSQRPMTIISASVMMVRWVCPLSKMGEKEAAEEEGWGIYPRSLLVAASLLHLDAEHKVAERTVDVLASALHGGVVGRVHGVDGEVGGAWASGAVQGVHLDVARAELTGGRRGRRSLVLHVGAAGAAAAATAATSAATLMLASATRLLVVLAAAFRIVVLVLSTSAAAIATGPAVRPGRRLVDVATVEPLFLAAAPDVRRTPMPLPPAHSSAQAAAAAARGRTGHASPWEARD